MDLFKRALQINPDNDAAYYNLGNALVAKEAELQRQ